MTDMQRWYLTGLPGGYEGWVVPEAAITAAEQECGERSHGHYMDGRSDALREAFGDLSIEEFVAENQRDMLARAVAEAKRQLFRKGGRLHSIGSSVDEGSGVEFCCSCGENQRAAENLLAALRGLGEPHECAWGQGECVPGCPNCKRMDELIAERAAGYDDCLRDTREAILDYYKVAPKAAEPFLRMLSSMSPKSGHQDTHQPQIDGTERHDEEQT